MTTQIDRLEVLDLLDSLVEKSLVIWDADCKRYHLMETTRKYAGEKLSEVNEIKHWNDQHLDYVARCAGAARDHGALLVWAEDEVDNLRAALEWSISTNLRTGFHLANAICDYWLTVGNFEEGRAWIGRLLSVESSAAPDIERLDLLINEGVFASRQGDIAAAKASYERALAMCENMDVPSERARALQGLAHVLTLQGDYLQAQMHLDASLAIRREIGQLWGVAMSLGGLGQLARVQGDHRRSKAYIEESLAIRREAGDQWGTALSLWGIGVSSMALGELASARRLLNESHEIWHEVDDRWGIANALTSLGELAMLEGDFASAKIQLEESIAIRRILGDRIGIAESLKALATLSVHLEEFDLAARLWAAAVKLREDLGAPLPPGEKDMFDREVHAAQTALGREAFASNWAVGAQLTVEEAIALALEEPS